MQTVRPEFHQRAQAGIRPHKQGIRIAFDKQSDPAIEWAEWDVSVWDGGDLWKPADDIPIQPWDYYQYQDFTDRLVDMEWSREIDFPYSVQASMADFTLSNYDNFFTPGAASPVDGYVLPKRPVRLFAGFQDVGMLQQFVGITERMPVIDHASKTASFHALDFLAEMFAMPLTQTVAMANVRTDEVLAELFQQFGLEPTQYSLEIAQNVIPFLFFEKGKNAGNAFRELMQAEMGNLWIDEQGIIRFEPRLLSNTDPVMLFNDSNTVDITHSGDSKIINTVRIRSDIRSVQELQPVYTSSDPTSGASLFTEPIIIPANSSTFVPVDLKDPLLNANIPTIGQKSDDSWFTVVNAGDETPVGSNVSISLTNLNNNNYVMLFENDNGFAVRLEKLEVWGRPARLVDEIRFEAHDEESVAAYGEQVLEIDNNMFGSESNCQSFALTIIESFKNLSSEIDITVKGDPSLQLGDVIEVDTRDVQGLYKVVKISEARRDNRAPCVLKARAYTSHSIAMWDVSVWDGGDVWAP